MKLTPKKFFTTTLNEWRRMGDNVNKLHEVETDYFMRIPLPLDSHKYSIDNLASSRHHRIWYLKDIDGLAIRMPDGVEAFHKIRINEKHKTSKKTVIRRLTGGWVKLANSPFARDYMGGYMIFDTEDPHKIINGRNPGLVLDMFHKLNTDRIITDMNIILRSYTDKELEEIIEACMNQEKLTETTTRMVHVELEHRKFYKPSIVYYEAGGLGEYKSYTSAIGLAGETYNVPSHGSNIGYWPAKWYTEGAFLVNESHII